MAVKIILSNDSIRLSQSGQPIGEFKNIPAGIDAHPHTPIYKMHKYFARRPHNVFRYLIEFYTKPGDIILDCFCGGGVTLFEGLATGRKVIAVDINPLATFITDCQMTPVSLTEYKAVMQEIWAAMQAMTSRFYSTTCRKTGQHVPVRWFELAYLVKCPACGLKTALSNDDKLAIDGKQRNGWYACRNCGKQFVAVNAEREGNELVSVTYRCPVSGDRMTVEPNQYDINLLHEADTRFEQLISEYNLWYPMDPIPEGWDRQQEDCLHRKGITRFDLLFTKRSLFHNAFLLKLIRERKQRVAPDVYKMLLFTFSSIIRYTNNMSFSTSGWMDGRPISWSKHAYWTPNQFVEVNPLEYVEKRWTAILSGLRFQQAKIKKSKRAQRFEQLTDENYTHIIWTRSSDDLDIPDESIDAVITDPPYGGNVQYGELSHFWLVWLRNEIGIDDSFFQLEREILVNRKTKALGYKTYDHYFKGLKSVFTEAYRVLKPSGVLVFTFNNKDMRAWYSVTKAAIKAGFTLGNDGVIYQEPIENYKNTAHTRYKGSIHGDFIYTFRKLPQKQNGDNDTPSPPREVNMHSKIINIAREYLQKNKEATTNEIYIAVMANLIPAMANLASRDQYPEKLNSMLKLNGIERPLRNEFAFDPQQKLWKLRNRNFCQEVAT